MIRRIASDSPSVVDVDLEAVAENTRHVRSLVGNDRTIYAALKCDAYGLGLIAVAHTILGAGGDAIAVARVGDAVALRDSGVRAPILLYPAQLPSPGLVQLLEQQRITSAVTDADSARSLARLTQGRMSVFLKLDVGLHRLGVVPEEAMAVARLIATLPQLHLEGIVTHLHIPADPVPEGYLEWQFGRLSRFLDQLDAAHYEVPVRMAASSGVLRLTDGMNLTAVDPGRLFLGLVEPGPATADRPWRQALRAFRTRLIAVKDVPADEYSSLAQIPVGHGTRIGVFPLGTSDGVGVASADHVLVGGRRAPIFSAITLEHCRVDLSGHPNARPGDEVVIVGRQGDQEITVQEVARYQGVPIVAVSTAIASSVSRVNREGPPVSGSVGRTFSGGSRGHADG